MLADGRGAKLADGLAAFLHHDCLRTVDSRVDASRLLVDAVMLADGQDAKLADAGLAAFLHHDFLAAKSNVGRFVWTVRCLDVPYDGIPCCHHMLQFQVPGLCRGRIASRSLHRGVFQTQRRSATDTPYWSCHLRRRCRRSGDCTLSLATFPLT